MFQRWLRSTRTVPTYVRSILGWTPGLRTLLRGSVLPCGCLTGQYETWRGSVVCIVDSADPRCSAPGHDTNAVLWQHVPTRLGPQVASAAR